MKYLVAYIYTILYSSFISCNLDCLIIFGDSLSDTGNLSRLTYGILPGSRYYNGRFSNGKIWVDYMKEKLNIKKVENYAYGAATTNNKVSTIWKVIPSITDQVKRYSDRIYNSCGSDKENYLVSYIGGTNDYQNITTSPFDVVSNIEKDLTMLIEDYGFEQIIVGNLPPVHLSPHVILTDSKRLNLFKLRAAIHNSLLSRLISKLSNLYPNVNLSLFEFGSDFSCISEWYDKPLPDGNPAYCFDENEDPDPCINPEDFFFYDTLHPSTEAHYALSEFIATKFDRHISQRCPPNHSYFKVFESH
jgi:phospholipase/lecithinase/hemolysin